MITESVFNCQNLFECSISKTSYENSILYLLMIVIQEKKINVDSNSCVYNGINLYLLHTGARVVYNMTNKSLNRVVSIDVIEMGSTYVVLDPNKYYHCISNSYLTEGRDFFDMIPRYMKNHR